MISWLPMPTLMRIARAHSLDFKNAFLSDWVQEMDDESRVAYIFYDDEQAAKQAAKRTRVPMSQGEPEELLRPVNGRLPPLLVSCVGRRAGRDYGCAGLFSSRALSEEVERLFAPEKFKQETTPTMVKCAQKTLAERLADKAQERTQALSWGAGAKWLDDGALQEEAKTWPFRCLWVSVRMSWDTPKAFFEEKWTEELYKACEELLGPHAHWVDFEGDLPLSRAGWEEEVVRREENVATFIEWMLGGARKERQERRALFAALGSAKKEKTSAPPPPKRKANRL